MKLPSEMDDPAAEIRGAVKTGEIDSATAIRYCDYWLRLYASKLKDREDDLAELLDDSDQVMAPEENGEWRSVGPRDDRDFKRAFEALEFEMSISQLSRLRYEIAIASGIYDKFATHSQVSAAVEAEYSGAPSRLVWKGKKADLGRVYRILGPLLGCTGAEWERHFMGPGGESMDGAVDNERKDGGMGRTNELPALRAAVKGMKPEAD